MIRTQIQLTENQAAALKALAKQHRVSMAELIRRSVGQLIRTERPTVSDEERRRRAIALIGRFRADLPDVAVNHDKYLEEAYMDWPEKQRQRGYNPSPTGRGTKEILHQRLVLRQAQSL